MPLAAGSSPDALCVEGRLQPRGVASVTRKGTPVERRGKEAVMRIERVSRLAVLALVGYDALLRPWMLDWGASGEERRRPLPGDDIVEEVMTHHTRALTIDAPPEAVWPWLVQIGDRR